MRKFLKRICPPILWDVVSRSKNKLVSNKAHSLNEEKTMTVLLEEPKEQDLGLYWTPEMAKILDEWGNDNVWNEIQLLLANCKGKVLDIACGTGKTIEILGKFNDLQVYGCDISDMLIKKGVERGIDESKLVVCDATNTNYLDNQFEYSYSIGSLEHFTLEGIEAFIRESYRITSKVSFHMIPTSKSQTDEGWMKTVQSFFNNSDEWWMKNFKKGFRKVEMVDSKWNDNISFGRWFICYK